MDGIWQKIFEVANCQADAVGEVQRVVSVDSTVIRSHQQSTVDRECLGRSCGELTSQLSIAVYGRGLAMEMAPS